MLFEMAQKYLTVMQVDPGQVSRVCRGCLSRHGSHLTRMCMNRHRFFLRGRVLLAGRIASHRHASFAQTQTPTSSPTT
jgi:hypothetical protein